MFVAVAVIVVAFILLFVALVRRDDNDDVDQQIALICLICDVYFFCDFWLGGEKGTGTGRISEYTVFQTEQTPPKSSCFGMTLTRFAKDSVQIPDRMRTPNPIEHTTLNTPKDRQYTE
jgi:hypothetical protein